jgi:Protein of unknown function (DUF3037)
VREPSVFDYATIRVVPRVERGEFVNVGVILLCSEHRFLEARIEIHPERLLALDPSLDLEAVALSLAAIPRICAGGPDAGPIGLLGARARFDWLVAPRSTIVQTSPAHSGLCDDPAAALERLMDRMVRTSPGARPGD